MHSIERTATDVAQLLRRFENIVAYTPVRAFLFISLALFIYFMITFDVWWGLGWGCLLFSCLCSALGI